MNRNTFSLLALAVIIAIMGACSSTPFDDLPRPVARFVTEYFPFGAIDSYHVDEATGASTVEIAHGATLTFDADCMWTDINGRGHTLPRQLLYDQLPTTLYDYIESAEMLDGVYRLQRSPADITVDFSDTRLIYDQVTQTITYR